ncbi:MAG TPA: twin-arginine translocase subunit TatC [Acidimicrobiales bacterium]|nr:twin-arginine translocase subunit TatC [Acidimicrobiales bacterium]
MNAQASPAEQGMTLIEHLTELRTRLIICVVAVGIGMLISFFAYEWIFNFLIDPYKDIANSSNSVGDGKLLQTDPLEGFGVRLKTSGYAGIALAMPVLLWQVWRFVTPGLYPHERRYAVPFVISALLLFVLGAGLAYYTLPRALDFLIDIAGDGFITAFSAGKYFQLITYMMLAFGIGFEFPIVLVFLQIAGIVDAAALRRARRFAIVGICVLVAVITPSGDPYSMLMLSVPMVVFYEISILIGSAIVKRRTAQAEVA